MRNEERFTDRVDTYVKYRPSYPAEAIDCLFGDVGLRPGDVVADIGSGTGKFAELLLERGCRVAAVEPNDAMREAAVRDLGGHDGYRAVPGSAERTGLPDRSVDGIVCAQSFHWFDRTAAQAEFRRIAKPGAPTALIWNTRLERGTPFLEGYERLLCDYGTDYERVKHKNISLEALRSFFREGTMRRTAFPSRQRLDRDELLGRLLSSSYSPLPGHPNYAPMVRALDELFERTQHDGRVSFEYETELIWGQV